MNTRERVIKKEINDFASHIVSDNAEWDGEGYSVEWSKVDKRDQDKLISLMVELDGKDFSIITENSEKYRDDILSKIINMIKSDTADSELDFAECVKKAAYSYFEDRASELIDELSGYYTHDTLEEMGLCLRQDRNHGDFIVQRI